MPMTYDDFKQLGMRLDLSRALLDEAGTAGFLSRDGIDCRNYGHLLGLPEAREFGAALLDVPADQVVAAGNSSLELMHDALAFAMLFGVPGGDAWRKHDDIAFLCPVPGYDRHFAICAALGIRMINVPLNDDGPDMDFVETQVANDPAIKGIWCVPLYSNPSGTIYSDEVVRRLAAMPAAAPDFRLFWDDAYRFHHLTEQRHTTLNVLDACAAAGHEDRALVFASLSKVTIGGGAMAFLAGSRRNVDWWQQRVSVRTIGPDKLNQLRHVRFLRDRAGLERLMERHRAVVSPKFAAVAAAFDEQFGDLPGVTWNAPAGGYFISLYTPTGFAKRTVALAAAAGLVLTPAGAAYPYGRDPDDRHLRIAPTFPALDEVRLAAQGITLSLRRALEEG
jgi:DNA-binding transcriptional MocR family regulator